MARGAEEGGAAERVERGVGRVLRGAGMMLITLLLVGAWVSTGIFTLQPGEAAVVLRLGKFHHTTFKEGLNWHLPVPIDRRSKLNYSELRREKFGYRDARNIGLEKQSQSQSESFETSIQTADRNVVNLSYVVQYKVGDPFAFLYRMAEPAQTLRDASQAAMREVVGGRRFEEVRSTDREGIQREAKRVLETTLDAYFADIGTASAFEIDAVELQDVQPPTLVQEAFDDVVAAQQDGERAEAEARGDALEIVERAKAAAREVREQASAYRDSRILEARGEAQRFEALLAEYSRAPEVTRRRLYLETMEVILPNVEKVIVEPDAVSLLPYFPIERSRPPRDSDEGGR